MLRRTNRFLFTRCSGCLPRFLPPYSHLPASRNHGSQYVRIYSGSLKSSSDMSAEGPDNVQDLMVMIWLVNALDNEPDEYSRARMPCVKPLSEQIARTSVHEGEPLASFTVPSHSLERQVPPRNQCHDSCGHVMCTFFSRGRLLQSFVNNVVFTIPSRHYCMPLVFVPSPTCLAYSFHFFSPFFLMFFHLH